MNRLQEYTLGIVIPVYRGYGRVKNVVDDLRRYAQARGIACRVVLVADGGGEQDNEAILAIADRYHGVSAVILKGHVGQQKALYYGIRQLGNCQMIATMDDDGAHPAALLDSLMEKINGGFDLCYAVSARWGYAPLRGFGAFCRNRLFSLCLGVPKGVRVSAYRVMTKELAFALVPEPDGFIYLSAAAMRLKPAVACLHYDALPNGPSRYTLTKLAALYRGLLFHYTWLKRFLPVREQTDAGIQAVKEGRGALWEP